MTLRTADTEDYADFGPYRTWYRIAGELTGGGPPPLVVLHGGPGATSDYLLSIAELATDGRAVIHYDQLGNGRSTRLPDKAGNGNFWTVALFVAELANLISHLGLSAYHVLGQSWGGFLAQEHALTHPAGLRSLVLADTAASFPAFVEQANLLRAELPPAVEETLRRHESAGTTGDPEYAAACEVFYVRHLCRLRPRPPEVEASLAALEEDPTVYHTMNGPSEFHVIGSIKDWSSESRLAEIDVPTLLVSGRYDEATPALQQTLAAGIRGAEWTIFEESSHMPHVEERERYLKVVGDWLARHD